MGLLSELTISTTSATESSPFVLWSWDSLPPYIIAAGARRHPSGMAGKDEMYGFWLKILTSAAYDRRLLKKVSVKAIRLNKGTWIKKMNACCNNFGWQKMGMVQLKDMSENELKKMLESVAWRRVRKEWSQDLENKPKLSMLKKIAEYEEESSCANMKMNSERRVLIKLRGGTAPFQMETGRWYGLKRRERVCKECDSGEVEDVVHWIWVIRCPAWTGHREALLKQYHDHSSDSDEEDTPTRNLCLACHNHKTAVVIHTCGRRILARSAGLILYPASH